MLRTVEASTEISGPARRATSARHHRAHRNRQRLRHLVVAHLLDDRRAESLRGELQRQLLPARVESSACSARASSSDLGRLRSVAGSGRRIIVGVQRDCRGSQPRLRGEKRVPQDAVHPGAEVRPPVCNEANPLSAFMYGLLHQVLGRRAVLRRASRRSCSGWRNAASPALQTARSRHHDWPQPHGLSQARPQLAASDGTPRGLCFTAGSAGWLVLNRRSSTASSDHLPGPFTSRKMVVMICAWSERISCSTAHGPIFGGDGGSGNGDVPRKIEILVARMATIISAMKGTAMSLVIRPESTSRPPTIAEAADKVCGQVRIRYPQLGETSDSLVGVDEFQDAFPEEDATRHESEDEDAAGVLSWWIEKP